MVLATQTLGGEQLDTLFACSQRTGFVKKYFLGAGTLKRPVFR